MPDELITMTRENLQAERDAWYENGLRNGRIRAIQMWRNAMNKDLEWWAK